jgi:hypothetical protein
MARFRVGTDNGRVGSDRVGGLAVLYLDFLSRIAALLGTVEVSEPVVQGIARVYRNPPAAIQDLPCFIIYPPSLAVARGSSLRVKRYAVRLRLLVLDADVGRAADLVDAYREAVMDLFDIDLTLAGTCSYIEGPDATDPASFTYGGRNYVSMDCLLRVVVEAAKVFA